VNDQTQIIQLFHKYINDACSPQEIQQLMQYFDNPANEEVLKGLIVDALATSGDETAKNNGASPGIPDKKLRDLLQQIKKRMKR
jgi:hypothetical protein